MANYAKLAVVFSSIDTGMVSNCFPDAQCAQYLKLITIAAASEMHFGYLAAPTPQAQLTRTRK